MKKSTIKIKAVIINVSMMNRIQIIITKINDKKLNNYLNISLDSN